MRQVSYRKCKRSRGQVLLLGVAVLIVLLLAALLLFDLHSVLRGKIKVETAQQAAALAGAQWQVAGLNMLGDLNIAKACTLMLEEESLIEATPFVPPPEQQNLSSADFEKLEKRHRLESRMRTLTEAQSRVSFILPLLGFAAIQQTAKHNGMSEEDTTLKHYLNNTLPLNDYRDKAIEGYYWYEPYVRLVAGIVAQRVVVRGNARVAEMPEVWSNPEGSRKIGSGANANFSLLLSDKALYRAIRDENFCYWQLVKMAKAGVYLDSPWWKINYIPGAFIGESEIMPLGVRYGGGEENVPEMFNRGLLDQFSGPSPWNMDLEMQPDRWCMYDSKWYGEHWTAEAYDNQQTNWRRDRWLRSDRLPGFLYEGAVSAVDGAVTTSRIMSFRAAPQPTLNSEPSGKLRIQEPLRKQGYSTVTIGRTSSSDSSNLGVVAKPFGGFNDMTSLDDRPIVTPVILPVFSRGLLIPSSMPYDLNMLTKGDDDLKRFLKWLATWPDIEQQAPPGGTEWYLIQLRKLMDPDYLLSIYNPDFPGLGDWDMAMLLEEDYYYPEHANGAGWLQRAYLGRAKTCPQTVTYTGKRFKCGNCDKCKREFSWIKKQGMTEQNCGSWEMELVPAVKDNVPTELPPTYIDEKGVERRYYPDYVNVTSRVYYGTEKGGYRYCIKNNGKIQNNEDVICNGHPARTCNGSGGMSWGIETGPTRL